MEWTQPTHVHMPTMRLLRELPTRKYLPRSDVRVFVEYNAMITSPTSLEFMAPKTILGNGECTPVDYVVIGTSAFGFSPHGWIKSTGVYEFYPSAYIDRKTFCVELAGDGSYLLSLGLDTSRRRPALTLRVGSCLRLSRRANSHPTTDIIPIADVVRNAEMLAAIRRRLAMSLSDYRGSREGAFRLVLEDMRLLDKLESMLTSAPTIVKEALKDATGDH